MAGETPRVMQSPRIEMTGLGGDELVDVEVVNLEPASDQEELERYPHGNSTAAGAVSNFVNTIVGAGIIGLPFAVSQVGMSCCTGCSCCEDRRAAPAQRDCKLRSRVVRHHTRYPYH